MRRLRSLPGAMLVAMLTYAPVKAQPATEATIGATVESLLAAGRRLSPSLRAAALDTEAVNAKANGADRLDDPTISDSYQYYKDPGVFSAHTVMLSQSFPLWGKRSLRRQAAMADVDASRGRERAAQDELDERIKVSFAQYVMLTRSIAVNWEVGGLARRMKGAALARYGQGGGDQLAAIQAFSEETASRAEALRLEGATGAAKARLNVLTGRPVDALLAPPLRGRSLPGGDPVLAVLVERARIGNSTLSSGTAAVAAARTRSTLADKAWYPDVTLGVGPLIQTNNRPVGFAATVGLNIPLPWGRQASGQQEAAAHLGASQQRYEASRLEVEGALAEAAARLRAARATEALLRREAAPQARAAFQAALAGYSQGHRELTAAIAAGRQAREVELRVLQAHLETQVEVAAIERLIGGEL